MMKRLTPLTLTISVALLMGVSGFWWGKYPSKQQAMDACSKWIEEGKFVEFREEKDDFQKGQDFEEKNFIDRTNIVSNPDFKDWLRRRKGYVNSTQYYPGTRKEYARKCVVEEEAKKVLGKENDLIRNGEYYFNKRIYGTYKVKKNFHY